MNPNTLTLISAAGFILAVFGASWLNQQAMNRRIDDLKSYFDARFDSIQREMSARFATVDARFDNVDQQNAGTNQKVDRIERQLEAIFKPILPKS
jgi:hypothetical protein